MLLVLVVGGLLAVGAARDAGARTPQERVEEISQRLACPICDGESVFESRNADSQAIRIEIARQVDTGTVSDDQIINFIEQRFGSKVLLVPKATGIDALVWALPVAALVCALVGLGVAFRRWKVAADTIPDDADRLLVAAALAHDARGFRGFRGFRGCRSPRPTRRSPGRRAVNPDQLAELEEQRRFLLRSITDLDREHQYGDVDDHDYETLRDGYTARAAAVLRAIEAGHAETTRAVRRRPRVIAAWIIGTVAVASLAGWLVARTSGQRLPGQSITGGLPGDEVARKLAEARQFLGVDPQQAIIRYQQVRELDPNNAEALTYLGWLVAQSGSAEAASAGAEFLRGAIKLDPTYADPHCFLAITSARFLQPPDTDSCAPRGPGLPRQQSTIADGRHDPGVRRFARRPDHNWLNRVREPTGWAEVP